MGRVLRDVEWVGNDQLDLAARDLRDFRFPFRGIRLGGRDHQFGLCQFDRQNIEARRIGGGHHIGNLGEIDFQRVDAKERQIDLGGHPLGQPVECQQAMRRRGGLQLALRDGGQRMHCHRCIFHQALCLRVVLLHLGLDDDAVGQEPRENLVQVKVLRRCFDHGGE